MKRKTGSILLSCALGAVLLGGCAITIAPASEVAAQSTIDNDEPSSSSFPDGPASPTGTPSPTAVEPTPESTRSEPVVYAPGRIADDGDALFEVPDGLDADYFHNFALYITVAIQNPIDSIENVDDKTAFRLSRCMLECFYAIFLPFRLPSTAANIGSNSLSSSCSAPMAGHPKAITS